MDRNEDGSQVEYYYNWSLPARGAWIEMFTLVFDRAFEFGSLPARGAWIEMLLLGGIPGMVYGRSPRGERG